MKKQNINKTPDMSVDNKKLTDIIQAIGNNWKKASALLALSCMLVACDGCSTADPTKNFAPESSGNSSTGGGTGTEGNGNTDSGGDESEGGNTEGELGDDSDFTPESLMDEYFAEIVNTSTMSADTLKGYSTQIETIFDTSHKLNRYPTRALKEVHITQSGDTEVDALNMMKFVQLADSINVELVLTADDGVPYSIDFISYASKRMSDSSKTNLDVLKDIRDVYSDSGMKVEDVIAGVDLVTVLSTENKYRRLELTNPNRKYSVNAGNYEYYYDGIYQLGGIVAANENNLSMSYSSMNISGEENLNNGKNTIAPLIFGENYSRLDTQDVYPNINNLMLTLDDSLNQLKDSKLKTLMDKYYAGPNGNTQYTKFSNKLKAGTSGGYGYTGSGGNMFSGQLLIDGQEELEAAYLRHIYTDPSMQTLFKNVKIVNSYSVNPLDDATITAQLINVHVTVDASKATFSSTGTSRGLVRFGNYAPKSLTMNGALVLTKLKENLTINEGVIMLDVSLVSDTELGYLKGELAPYSSSTSIPQEIHFGSKDALTKTGFSQSYPNSSYRDINIYIPNGSGGQPGEKVYAVTSSLASNALYGTTTSQALEYRRNATLENWAQIVNDNSINTIQKETANISEYNSTAMNSVDFDKDTYFATGQVNQNYKLTKAYKDQQEEEYLALANKYLKDIQRG